jgi:hypothetical protein
MADYREKVAHASALMLLEAQWPHRTQADGIARNIIIIGRATQALVAADRTSARASLGTSKECADFH